MDIKDIPINEQELLYDPMFADNPDNILRDNPEKGIFGKIVFKKALFIIALLFFINVSMYFSFRTVSKELYKFNQDGILEDGSPLYVLSEYHGNEQKVLSVDYVRNEDDIPDTDKPVFKVGKYAVKCNEMLNLIYISDTVEIIDPKAFYTCKNLMAFFVDENNPNYKSVDGVLYRLENGEIAEIMMYPPKNPEYLAALKLGAKSPSSSDDAEAFLEKHRNLQNEQPSAATGKNRIQSEAQDSFSVFIIPETVKVVNELCFAECTALKEIKIPDSVTVIETLAFFKCSALQRIDIPDSVVTIGLDAFSNCTSINDIFIPSYVKAIGHHAFYNCPGVETVRMECSEEEAKEMYLGSVWLLPEHVYRRT